MTIIAFPKIGDYTGLQTTEFEFLNLVGNDVNISQQLSELVFMIHPGRCGSTVLGDLLNQSKHLKWDSEIFTPQHHIEIPKSENGDILWRELFRQRQKHSIRPFVGFEIKTSQIFYKKIVADSLEATLDSVSAYTQKPLLYLYRRNHIERHISLLRAQKTDKFSRKSGQKSVEVAVSLPRRVHDHAYNILDCDISEWLDRADKIQRQITSSVESRGGAMFIFEDDIEKNVVSTCGLILDCLAIPRHEPHLRYERIDGRPTSSKILNLDEVKDWLTDEQAKRFLGET